MPADPPPSASCASPFVLLDDALAPAGEQRSRLYTDWQHTARFAPQAADTLDLHLLDGWQRGWHCVVLIPYEFSTPALPPHLAGSLHCLWFQTCTRLDRDEAAHWLAAQDTRDAPAGLLNLQPDTDAARFSTIVEYIRNLIAAGDTYQVNYTHRWHAEIFGDPLRLYRALRARQPVPFGALARLDDDQWILSLSPERFLAHDGHGRLTTEPMKGTAPLETSDPTALARDPKNRAENLMIVDLMRNDLGKIAQTGSVQVTELFAVKPFGQVWQMTSTISAHMRPHTRYADILAALFPCGSITGAPKQRTQQIIRHIEPDARGLYTGAIGWLDPAIHTDYPGPFSLSVAIRTLIAAPLNTAGLRPAQIGIGSGITYDSQAAEEYAECGWKARFLTEHDPGFALIETLRVENRTLPLLHAHLQRLAHSASALGFVCNLDAIQASMQTAIQTTLTAASTHPLARLRLCLYKAGTFDLDLAPLPPAPAGPVKIILAPEPLPLTDPLRRHKTTHRAHYDQAWQRAEQHGAFDSLLFNPRGELLEGGRSSVFIKLNGTWLTPPLSLDILPGVMRAQLLTRPHHALDGPAAEARITRTMLEQADAIVLVNALRGVLSAELSRD